MKFSFLRKGAVGLLLVQFAVGCATISGPPPTPEQTVKARAQERWDAMVAGQFDKAFEYLTPTTRITLPKDVFRSRLAGAKWRGAKVTGAVCEPEVCEVTVTIDIDVLPNLPYKQPISEKWLLVDGKWWIVYRG